MFHEYCNKLIAYLRGMLGIVKQTVLLSLHLLLQLWIFLNLDTFTFNLLLPSNFIEAFPEENRVHKYSLVETLVHFLRDSVKVKSKDLINKHVLSVSIREVIIVLCPLFLSSTLIKLDLFIGCTFLL